MAQAGPAYACGRRRGPRPGDRPRLAGRRNAVPALRTRALRHRSAGIVWLLACTCPASSACSRARLPARALWSHGPGLTSRSRREPRWRPRPGKRPAARSHTAGDGQARGRSTANRLIWWASSRADW